MEPKPVNRTAWIAAGIIGVIVLVALAIVFDLGPFGDDELTEAEFIARGDEICSQAHTDFEEAQGSPPRTATEAEELTDELVAIAREELNAIRDLNGPASLDTAVERYLTAREGGIDEIRAGLEAAEQGDAVAYGAAQAKLASSQLERRDLAAKVGFDECSTVLFGRDQLAEDSQPPVNTDPSAPPTVNNPPTGTP